jgi:calcium/proton exchanger cax
MGKSTDDIACFCGQKIGGLLNATFGNATELIIAFVAMKEGLFDVVKASLAGSVIGNILPIPFILLFIDKVFDWLRPTRHFGGFVQKLEDRAMSKSSGVSKAEFWGLVAFVGIPVPGTGGWTGALIASMLKIDLKKASLAILLGIAIAATIMSLISYGVFRM